jgi:ribose/xylose/arabinose/galactoside ABC-type transport system permease subunit
MTQVLATLRNSGALIVLVVTYVVFSIAAPSFFGVQNLLDIVHVISPMMIVATGMALVVMSGKLDISVGSIAYVASALFALMMRNGSLSFPVAVRSRSWPDSLLGASMRPLWSVSRSIH